MADSREATIARAHGISNLARYAFKCLQLSLRTAQLLDVMPRH
jgi:hypothetical protein